MMFASFWRNFNQKLANIPPGKMLANIPPPKNLGGFPKSNSSEPNNNQLKKNAQDGVLKKHDFGMDLWFQDGRLRKARTSIPHYTWCKIQGCVASRKNIWNHMQKGSNVIPKLIFGRYGVWVLSFRKVFGEVWFSMDLWLAQTEICIRGSDWLRQRAIFAGVRRKPQASWSSWICRIRAKIRHASGTPLCETGVAGPNPPGSASTSAPVIVAWGLVQLI